MWILSKVLLSKCETFSKLHLRAYYFLAQIYWLTYGLSYKTFYESIVTPLFLTCGLYFKPMMIVNDNSRVVNKLEASLTDDARVIIYDRHMFIVQATASGRGYRGARPRQIR